MKKPLFAISFLTLSLLAACGGANASSSAAGTYELDKAAIKTAMLAQGPKSPEAEKQADTMLGVIPAMVMELKADGSAAVTTKATELSKETQETGTWKLEGNKVTIVTKGEKEETQTGTLENGVITMEHGAGGQKMKVTFKKK